MQIAPFLRAIALSHIATSSAVRPSARHYAGVEPKQWNLGARGFRRHLYST